MSETGTTSTVSPFSSTENPAVSVTIEHLSKSFGDFGVLKDISFKVEPGEIFVLMGPSGSGKSVLLKHLVGLELPSSGRVLIDKYDASREETREKVRLALVFQAGALFSSLSVYDNLALYLREHRLADEAGIHEKVMRALQILSLENAAKKYPSELSGGMKKRAGFARALVLEPQIVMFDEPDSGLDPVRTALLCQLIEKVHAENGGTYVVITHDIASARRIGEYIAVLWKGRIVQSGDRDDMFDSPNPFVRQFLAGNPGGPLGME